MARRATRTGQPEGGSAIVVTGFCGRLGKRVTRVLHRTERVVGIDRRPFPEAPPDVVHHAIDIRRKKCRDVFRRGEVKAVLHLGVMHDPRQGSVEHHTWNVVAFAKLLEYVAEYRIPKLVVLSTANIYGPQPGNAQFLGEDAPLLGGASYPEIRDLVEADMLAQSFFWKHPKIETVILRPVHILGTVKNAPSNYLRRPWVMTLLGFDPMVQVIHEDDVVQAITLALRPGMRGIFNLAGAGEAPLSRMLRALGKRRVPVPHVVAKPALRAMWRFGLTGFPPPEVDHIRYVCMVDGTRAREVLGFEPRHSLEETLHAVEDA